MPNVGNFRVTQEDYDRIKDYAARSERPLSDIYREAVLQYIDQEREKEDDEYFVQRMRERDKHIADALKSIENRFATLIVRLGIDLESLYALAWSLTKEQPDQEELFTKCYQVGVKRFRRTMKGLERDMVDSLIHQADTLKPAKSRAKSIDDDDADVEE